MEAFQLRRIRLLFARFREIEDKKNMIAGT